MKHFRHLIIVAIFCTPLQLGAIDISVHDRWVGLQLITGGYGLQVGTHLQGKTAVELNFVNASSEPYGEPNNRLISLALFVKSSLGPLYFGAGPSLSSISQGVDCDYERSYDYQTYRYRHENLNVAATLGLRWPVFDGFLGFEIATAHFPLVKLSAKYDDEIPKSWRKESEDLENDFAGTALSFQAGYKL